MVEIPLHLHYKNILESKMASQFELALKMSNIYLHHMAHSQPLNSAIQSLYLSFLSDMDRYF